MQPVTLWVYDEDSPEKSRNFGGLIISITHTFATLVADMIWRHSMKTLYLAGAVLSGVLAVAPAQADQCAKVGDPTGDFHAIVATPTGICQLDDGQLSEISGGKLITPITVFDRAAASRTGCATDMGKLPPMNDVRRAENGRLHRP